MKHGIASVNGHQVKGSQNGLLHKFFWLMDLVGSILATRLGAKMVARMLYV